MVRIASKDAGGMPFINGNIVAKKVPSGIAFVGHPTKTATTTRSEDPCTHKLEH